MINSDPFAPFDAIEAFVHQEHEVSHDPSESLLNSIADALWGDGADTEWSADTVQAIADAILLQRPDLYEARQ